MIKLDPDVLDDAADIIQAAVGPNIEVLKGYVEDLHNYAEALRQANVFLVRIHDDYLPLVEKQAAQAGEEIPEWIGETVQHYVAWRDARNFDLDA